jgi:hypothetical protein
VSACSAKKTPTAEPPAVEQKSRNRRFLSNLHPPRVHQYPCA